MKIDYFVAASDDELSRAVAEIMAIYGVHAGPGISPEQLPQHLPLRTVFYVTYVYQEGRRSVTETEFWYRSDSGQIIRDREKSTLAKREETSAELKRLAKVNAWRIMLRITGQAPSPWGILRGVRPAKIVHRLLDRGLGCQDIAQLLEREYLLAAEKAKLIADVASYQRKWLMEGDAHFQTVSIYIGIPYCPSRCLYCSFPAYVIPGDRKVIAPFTGALRKDINAAARLINDYGLSVQSVYIGGGTPTSLDSEQFEELLAETVSNLVQPTTLEFTVEAGRPDSMDDTKISRMKQYGVTRVSVNPQTMQEKTLKRIGRNHTVEDIINIFGKIRNYNFPVVNMDIIAGLPGETAEDVRDTMEQIMGLEPENLTVHTLAIKKGSILKENREYSSLPGAEEVRKMLALAKSGALQAGMTAYYLYRQKYMTGQMENVGYTKPGLECVYNIQIMEERQTIIGIGPNAVTKAVGRDYSLESSYLPKDINTYINGLDTYMDKRNRLLHSLYSQCTGGSYADKRSARD